MKSRTVQAKAPATQQVQEALNADQHQVAVQVVQGLLRKADLQAVGLATGFQMYYGESAGAYRARFAAVADQLTRSARERATKERYCLDRLMDLAREYDRSFDHAERARKNGVADDSTAFIGFYRPAQGADFQEMRIPELLLQLESDLRQLQAEMGSDEVFLRMQDRARGARPRIFEAAGRGAEEKAAPVQEGEEAVT